MPREAPYQSDETTELIMTFPENYPDSAAYAAYERAQELDQIEAERRAEDHIAADYGDCGVSKHIGLDEGWANERGDQMPGLPYGLPL